MEQKIQGTKKMFSFTTRDSGRYASNGRKEFTPTGMIYSDTPEEFVASVSMTQDGEAKFIQRFTTAEDAHNFINGIFEKGGFFQDFDQVSTRNGWMPA